MENAVASFDKGIRKDVYNSAGTGKYPVSPQEWISGSTDAINNVLAISDAVTEVNSIKAARVTGQSRWKMLLVVILICAVIACVVIVLMLVYDKTRRIEYLRESMGQIAGGAGDLTFRLDASSGDEIGKTSEAFNQFRDQLQVIIQQVKQATEQVSSAAMLWKRLLKE